MSYMYICSLCTKIKKKKKRHTHKEGRAGKVSLITLIHHEQFQKALKCFWNVSKLSSMASIYLLPWLLMSLTLKARSLSWFERSKQKQTTAVWGKWKKMQLIHHLFSLPLRRRTKGSQTGEQTECRHIQIHNAFCIKDAKRERDTFSARYCTVARWSKWF